MDLMLVALSRRTWHWTAKGGRGNASHDESSACGKVAARGTNATPVAQRQPSPEVKTQRRAHDPRTPRSCAVSVAISAESGVICKPQERVDFFNRRRPAVDVNSAKRVRARESHCMTWNAAPVKLNQDVQWSDGSIALTHSSPSSGKDSSQS
jgi:hypothetical protein